tara:strand:- start:38 stop:238 length:201 start_codon:yes stop_codon:yes gene_type:complete
MPFKYITANETTTGDLSIIPNKHREEALRQKRNTIECNQLNWYCPITIVDIGESIMYILDNDDLHI